jgi:excisionase family DNA binding protein
VNPDRLHILSTGQAARYCGVTSYTVGNWVKAGKLSASRTEGGQYRIDVCDLRAFMAQNSMPTDQIDTDFSLKPHCWEFWSMRRAAAGLVCDSCLVRQSNAWKCWELHSVLPPNKRQCGNCAECDYYLTWVRNERHVSQIDVG